MSQPQDLLNKLEEFKELISTALFKMNELDEPCKTVLLRCTTGTVHPVKSNMIKIQAILDYMHEKVNIGNWKEVRPFLRQTITIASYLKLILQVTSLLDTTEMDLKELFKTIDFGLLFGCPLDKEPTLLQKCATIINTIYVPQTTTNETEVLNLECFKSKTESGPKAVNYNASQLEVLDCPSMEYFFNNHILPQKPVLLKNCMTHWPALQKWQDQSYFKKLAGMRTVSIELGSKYTDTNWTQKLMTIGEFIENHINQSNNLKGYLAQYELFDQIPELKNDIVEPEYCCFSDSNDPVAVMAWYGPKGTVSPLHHDPKRNLLAQVVGEKQIFLFSPEDSDNLYPHEHELLNNTAQVDPRRPDLEKYPKYRDAKAYYCVLKPGQMLYIPPKWWHFVESLSISFSVSFWWE